MELSSTKKKARASNSQSVRKRHRVAIVCVNCRRKKIKCDKLKPECDNCVKSNLKCQYQDLVWAASTMVDDDGKMSSYHDYGGQNTFIVSKNGLVPYSEKGTHKDELEEHLECNRQSTKSKSPLSQESQTGMPYLDIKETMDFFEGTISTDEIVRSGPFSWVIFASKDRFIRVLWLIASQTKQRQILYLNTGANDHSTNEEKHSQDHYLNLKSLKQKGFVPSYQPIPAEQLTNVILRSLPTKKALWILVPRFFEYLYPYFSYLDWNQFIDTITKCLNTHDKDLKNEKFTAVTITKKSSLCHLAMLFVVLRFGYLSLCEELIDFSEEREYVSKDPITAKSVNTAQILLNQFNIFDKPPLELLEAYIYMRTYHHYSPEQGDNTGIADSTVYNGIVVSLAVALGLNRDPGTIEQFKNDIKLCNLRRRLWHFVAMFDLYQSVSMGRHIAYTASDHDVKFPELEGDDLDSWENRVTLGFKAYCGGHDIVSKTAALLANANNVNVYELIKGIERVEEMKNSRFKSMADIIGDNSDLNRKPHVRLKRVVQLIRYVFLNTFCFTAEYNVFLHFENSSKGRTDLARYYLSKIVNRSNETMNSLPSLMTRGSDFFGYGLDIIQFPATLLSLHKALQVQTSLSLRCQHLMKLITLKESVGALTKPLEQNRKIQRYLKSIIRSISKKLENYLENLDHACKTYQYAWRLKRPHTLYWLITSQDCFDIKDGQIVATDVNKFEQKRPDIPQTNILEGMSLGELMTLYPISNKEVELSTKTRKLEFGGKELDDPAPVSPSIKDERSPSISNLLNHEKSESSSTNSSSTFLKSPNLTNMKSVVDPSVDENWIKMLYSDQDQKVDFANYSFQYLDDPNRLQHTTSPNTVTFPSLPQQQQGNIPNTRVPGQTNSTQLVPVYQTEHALQGQFQHTQHMQQHTQHQQHQQQHQHQQHPAAYYMPQHNALVQSNGALAPPQNNMNFQENHMMMYNNNIIPGPSAQLHNNKPANHQTFENSQQNGSIEVHEFFSLIGAGGFNTIDEMFGSVEFYDKPL